MSYSFKKGDLVVSDPGKYYITNEFAICRVVSDSSYEGFMHVVVIDSTITEEEYNKARKAQQVSHRICMWSELQLNIGQKKSFEVLADSFKPLESSIEDIEVC